MSEDWGFGKLLLLQEHWEWETAGVLGVDFFNFDSSIRQEVVEDVVFITTVISSILPKDMEAKHLSIIVQEALKGFVWSSTLKLNFDVVFHLSLIRRSLLEVDHSSGMSEEIFWVSLRGSKSDSLVCVESPGEIIAVNDSENSLVDIEVDTNVEVLPDVVFRLVIWIWKLMSLQKDSLWHSRVLNSWLDDVDGVIVKVVVDDAFSDSVVFVWVFNNWFLEVSVEAEYL